MQRFQPRACNGHRRTYVIHTLEDLHFWGAQNNHNKKSMVGERRPEPKLRATIRRDSLVPVNKTVIIVGFITTATHALPLSQLLS